MTDIDPKRLHVGTGKRKRRKSRDLPDPPEYVKAEQPAAPSRVKRRPLSPGVMLEPRDGDEPGWEITSPHSDQEFWELQLADAFGTRSLSVIQTFMRDLKALTRQDWDADAQQWKADERALNAALAMVADHKPRNTAEAALLAQMVAVHWMQMRLSARALSGGALIYEKEAALAGKLARTYAMQLEALRALRGGKRPTRQTIIVRRENHVHYHDHRDGGVAGNGRRPLEPPAAITGDCEEVRSNDEGADIVPLRRVEGPR